MLGGFGGEGFGGGVAKRRVFGVPVAAIGRLEGRNRAQTWT